MDSRKSFSNRIQGSSESRSLPRCDWRCAIHSYPSECHRDGAFPVGPGYDPATAMEPLLIKRTEHSRAPNWLVAGVPPLEYFNGTGGAERQTCRASGACCRAVTQIDPRSAPTDMTELLSRGPGNKRERWDIPGDH